MHVIGLGACRAQGFRVWDNCFPPSGTSGFADLVCKVPGCDEAGSPFSTRSNEPGSQAGFKWPLLRFTISLALICSLRLLLRLRR